MKMKNLVAYAMLALGAVAAPFAAMAGDIAEIRPWLDTREDVNEELKAGQSLKFVVRLASRSIEEPAQWSPVYLGGGSQLLPQLYMPKMGLVLSGKLRYAELISWGPNIKKGEVFTDLIFEYVVQPGDFAQPALLALSTSTELQPVFADTTRSGGEQSYFLKNVVGYDPAGTMFKFCDTNGNECAFSYMALNDERMNKLSSKWPEGGQNLDIDLAGELNHYMLKSIDFDDRTEVDSEDGVTYWRVVKEGDTQTLAYNPRIETIGIYGTNVVQIGSAPRYYVWSDNEDAVTLEKAKGAKRMTLHPPKADGTKSEGKDVWVYTFDLVTGQQAYEFAVYGVAQGKKANLILSGSSDYAYNSAGTVVTNFLVSPLAVKCGAKPPPSIRLTWQETGKAGYNPETGDPAICVYTNDISEIAEQGHQIAVEVRNGTFSVPVTLVLKARVENGDDWDYVYTNSLIRTAICEPGDIPEFVPTEPQVEVKFTPGGSLMKNIFVYPIGSEVKSGTKGQYVEFKLEWGAGTPQEIKDAFMPLSDVCTLRAVDAVPAVISPQAGDVFQIEDPIPVMVMDSYRDLTPPRRFETRVRYGQQTLYITTNSYSSTGPTEITLDRAKVLSVLRQKKEEYEADVQIEVSDPLKQKGTCAIKLVIPALPPEQPMVYAELYDSTSEGSLHPSADFKEGEAPIVRFRLDTPLAVDSSGANDRYAFLVPQNWASSNLVKYAGLENGVLIAGGKTNSVLSLGAQMKLLDGCAETDMSQNLQMSFAIVLKTASGDVDATYRPDPNGLQFTVQNVKPVSQGLFINGSSDSTPDGGRFPVEISSGIEQTFVASYAEAYDWPDAKNVDLTNGIVTVWCFTDGKNSNTYKYSAVTSTTDTATCMHSFTYAGGADQQVKWIPVDKDMLWQLLGDTPLTAANLQSLWPSLLKIATPYTATVHVGDAPHIVLGQEETFVREDSKTDKVQITLSEPYDGGSIFLKVTLTALDEYAAEPGHASFQQAVLEIERGALEPKKTTKYNNGLKFDYEELDGTAVSAMDGFFLEVDAYEDAACTIPVSWYAKAEGYVYVNNVPPAITPKEPENLTTNKTLSVNEAFTLQWSVNDVKRDLARGLTCKWYIDDNVQGDLTKVVTDKLAKETTLKFTSDGFHEVRLEVEDKDGEDVDGKATRRWFYYISPTKALEVKAVGPGLVTKTKYGTAAGRGEGRVWANGIKGTAEAFAQTWTYGVKTTEAEVHAYGYAASNTVYRDNGNLGGKGRDLAIDVNGDSFGETVVEADCYQVSGIYDNYFYRWAIIGGTEGSDSSVTLLAPQPTPQPTLDVSESIPLDPYEDSKESYSKRKVEAIFAREYLASDNMGDINLDGIPDLYVKRYGFNIMDTNSGELTGDDIKSITVNFNGNVDGDYLPSTEVSAFGNLIPGLKGTWVEFGTPFNAKTEIRGYHEGLNDAPGVIGIPGVRPDRIYEVTNGLGQAVYDPEVCTISRLEYLAWKDSGLPADQWSPECPTDPMEADTDEDGFTDGYEYFFWYRAHVGYIDTDGSHKYLTGERYDPANPGVGIPITSKEIEDLFNPRASSGDESEAKYRDTDNDGLPDLVEFEIGTNPIHWDTDGDGLPDGYEVMFRDGTLGSGAAVPLDPLLASTVVGLPDCLRNYDGDYMAFYTNMPYAVFALQGADGAAAFYAGEAKQLVPQQFAALTNGAGAVDFKDGWVITAADGGKYMTSRAVSAADYYEFEGAYYLRTDLGRDVCWTYAETKFSDGGAEKTAAYRSLPAELPRGTRLGTVVESGVTNVLVSATNYVTMVTEFGVIKVVVDEMTGTATTNKTLAAWDGSQRPPQRAYHVWQYGRKGMLSVDKKLYGGWALSGEAFLKNGAVVLRMPAAETVFAYHNLAYSKGGFDPRTAWSGDNDFGISWAIDDVALSGDATNHLGAVNTRAYNDYDEFLVMAYFINNSIAGLAVGDALPDIEGDYATCLEPGEYTPTRILPLQTIWGRFCTNAYDPDTDMDGVPDGWELYIMGGPDKDDDKHPVLMALPGPISPWSPLFNLANVVNKDEDGDGLDERAEFSGVSSVKAYEEVSTTITLVDEFWTNKAMPTDPWNKDTDDDGLTDGEEGKAFKYGEPEKAGAGGGLNPLSWDTDGDGLPDPWELQYAGTFTAGAQSESTTTSIGADGSSNTTVKVTREKGTWSGGMDGTVNDAMEDYDADGLLNWQEYMVNCMRHFRYDDTTSRWNNDTCTEDDIMMAMSFAAQGDMWSWGEWWGSRLVDEQNYEGGFNPHLFDGAFDNGASWFSLCTNEWDTAHGRWYMFYDGVYHDLSRPPARYKFGTGDQAVQYNRFSWKFAENGPPNAPMGPVKWGESIKQMYIPPKEYPGTDPTKADTDNDGMDDYYELFHGLNPLLGEAGNYDNGHKPPVDRVFEAYGGGEMTKTGNTSGLTPLVSAKNNYWLNAMVPHGTVKAEPRTKYGNDMDFEQYPWLAGTSEADPDGDNIRNYQEAIMANMQAASTYLHTDPTPLWMTDASYSMSFVHRYYKPLAAPGWIIMGVPGYFDYDSDGDGEDEHYEFKDFPGFTYDEQKMILTTSGYDANPWHADNYVASFEQNEGYDSDHDFLGDFEEAQGRTKQASDPQDSDDPRRRQAMWFNGTDAFLQTPLAVSETAPLEGIGIQAEQPFLYFTVECWAKPANPGKKGLQTLVERAIWTDPAHGADEKYLRKNFLLGIRDGHWYAKFDSTGTDALKAEEISDGPEATTNWTHVAMSYGEVPGIGLALRLYVNGDCVKTKATEVQPEHGTKAATINETGELRDGKLSYNEISILAGASAATELGIVFDSLYRGMSLFGTTLTDYTAFYEGYIDEIRIWDGARSEKQIGDDHMKRYTAEDALANRLEFFNGWSEYGTRAPSTSAELIPELRYHFTFDHLPGAPDVADVIAVPAGFSTDGSMTDAAAIWMRPQGWACPHWSSVAVRSTVYSDPAWVPWINNTITHLPRFDQTTQDSFYWSENYAGADAAMDLGFKNFLFPRTHETPSVWTPMTYTRQGAWDATPTRYNIIKDTPLYRSWCFTIRHSLVEGGDFLPMGGAFPKRISAAEGGMWDGQGAADAWAQTGSDSNGDGLPDWWEAYARANYAEDLDPSEPLTWNTLVVRDGVPMTAMQAYLRDLAEGLLSDGDYHAEYRDTVDSDGDGLPDWWESYWALKNTNGFGDPDHDGLSNFQEWKVSEDEANGFGTANGYPLVNPTLMRSHDGQDFPDYFLRMDDGDKAGRFKGMYLGEIVADHDFMEDDLEGDLGTDRTLYDAWSDNDEDGWSAWAELRYSTFKMTRAARFVSHIVGDEEVKDFPVPVIHATLRYNGAKTLAGSNATITVEAYSGNNVQKSPNAYYFIRPGAREQRQLYLGAYEDRVIHGTLTPGRFTQADLNSVSLQGAFVQPNDKFSWTVASTNGTGGAYTGTYEEMRAAYLQYGTNMTVAAQSFGWVDIVKANDPSRNWLQVTQDEKTQTGFILADNEKVGEIDLATGDFTFDLGKLKGRQMVDSGISFEQMFYRLQYTVAVPALQTKALTLSLANPDVGSLTEGTTAFVAYMDLDGDGYTPETDPIGFVKGVEIGWDQVPELTIEMTDFSQAAGERFAYGEDVGTLRVIRTAINGRPYLDAKGEVPVKRRIVYSREASDMDRRTVYEGDLVTAGKFGLDWAALRSDLDAAGVDPKDVTEVSYLVVRDTQSLSHIAASNVIRTITVAYPSQQVKPTPLSPSAKSMPVVETARPVFKWSGTADNTAFTFQIADPAKNVVFSNDLAVLPPRDASGNYVWTAPVFIGRDDCGDAWALANNSNYVWRVAMFNQKYSRPETDAQWSDWSAFRTALAEKNDFTTKYGSAEVAVRYFGPATNELGDVIVQLYRTADFTGVPVAQTRLFDVAGKLISLTNGQTVAFHGLASGDYYACAFIDRNGDSVRQRYETWGYSANVGRGTSDIWTPVAVAVDAANAKTGSAAVYLEDTDVNQNDVPDCLDDEEILKAAVEGGTSGSDTTDTDGDGLTGDEETSDTYTDRQKWDTDGDGMPDGWEAKFADLDPLFNDAAEFMPGDVMAFEAEDGVRVRNAAGATYLLLAPSNVTYRVGDLVTNEHLYTCYDYQTVVGEGTNAAAVTYCGFGTNLTGTAATFKIDRIEPVTVAYVHAQVYDRYGYSLKTAIPQDGAVHTKQFMAIDKYMVVRYLAALGLADEETMNKGGTWKNSTLKPMDADNDRDGMLDGWELYVMFGTNGCGYVTNGVGQVVRATALSQAVISPWKPGDRALDLDGDGLANVDENSDGNDPSDPWNPYSVYESLVADGVIPPDTEKFDDKVRRFGIGASELNDDWDLDLISNGQEMWSYYLDYANKSTLLGDIDPTNAWSNGSTPDYFRTFATKAGETNYLGAVWNGAEFIEPAGRDALGMKGLERAGTRDYDWSGWDYWSVVRNGFDGEYAGINDTDLTFVLRYIDAVMPGECSAKTLPELREFVHAQWAGVERTAWNYTWDYDYDYSYTYDPETGTYRYERGTDNDDDTDTRMTLVGDKLVTLDEMISFFGGRAKMEKTIDSNKQALALDEITLPEPKIDLIVKYAGDKKYVLLVDAYQVNPAYPEYGEQRTAFWNTSAEFNAGVARLSLATANAGSLKQGPARFVAYIDADGDGKLSSGDTWGSATTEIGYLGCDLTIALGAENPALPALWLTDGTNTYSTLALVRSEINGKPLYNSAKGVFVVQFQNNASREALYPDEYDTGDYIGIDPTLASLANVGEIETVTYEVLRLRADEVAGLSVTNLNNYMIITTVETNGTVIVSSNVVNQAVNETVTLNYSLDRDVAKSIACAGSTADDFTFTFTVPTDTVNTKFWLNVQTNGAAAATLLGGTKGFILKNVRDGVVVLDKAWFEENRVTIPTGRTKFGVVLGNDKFRRPSPAVCAMAEVFINEGASFDGRLAVKAEHPIADLDAQLTIAAYETADLVNPVVVSNGCAAGATVELTGLRPDGTYYVAAWYVKDAADGRGSKARRMPYDTWGYVTSLGEVESGFEAKALTAELLPSVTNTVWLQDTDFNANGTPDREEDFSAENGDYIGSIDPTYGFEIAGVEETEIFSDAMENDVFAYAEVPFYCVMAEVGGAETWFAVTDLAAETVSDRLTPGIPVGTSLSNLNSLASTYLYDYGKTNPRRLALGTNVTWTGSEKVMQVAGAKALILVHAQVYDRFGFSPDTANGLIAKSAWVNTRAFTSVDKAYVTNYLANVCGLTNAWTYALPIDYPDADPVAEGRGDGILDGWELYVMFGTNAVKSAETMRHSPWTFADRAYDADADGLDQLHEYDGGYCPTDPWNLDTDNDGISDYHARTWYLKGGQYRQDYDNDGLSNFQEFLSSVALTNSLGTPVIAADNRRTYGQDGQLVPDYFLRVGSLYLGEILTDHDFIEDWLEDSDALFSGDRKASRYQYDAHLDADGNGWDNWSEARAYLAAGTHVAYDVVTNGEQVVTNAYEVSNYTGRPTPTGRIKVVYNGTSDYAGNLVVQSFRCVDGKVPEMSAKPDATWILPVGQKSAWYELGSPTNGFVRGGKNLFVVYNDGDADGVWTPGEPYGLVTDVDVGYEKIADSEVELTDINSSTLRIRLGQAVRTAGYDAQNVLTDRGRKPSPKWPNALFDAEHPYKPIDAAESSVRIRLVRLSINDVTSWPSKGRYAMTVVMDFPLTYISDDLVFDEFTLLSQGKFEPSWGTLRQAWADIGYPSTPQDISKVTYGFAIGPGDLHPDRPGEDNFLDVTFSLGYEALGQQTKTVPTGALTRADDNRPTFTWTHENTIGKAYPAFRLRVYRKSDKKLMYDSNDMRAPARNSEGVYSWRPPLYAGVKTPTGAVFDNGTYYFTVSMLDAKFTTPNTDEEKFEFTLNANGVGGDLSDQYSIFAAVKYFGPVETNKTIRVEAFGSPDFVGRPAAVTSVRNCDDLMTTNSLTLNAMLIGLEAGKPYYVRAFIDTNENGVKDDIESWGYGNYFDTDRRDIYTPRAYMAKKGSFQMPEAVVYIEDVDRNNDGIPDARTDLTVTPTNSPYVVTYDGSAVGAKPIASNLFAAMGGDVILLPFVSQLHTLSNGGTLSALQLCYAMSRGDVPSVAQLKTASDVRVTSFSLEDGIRIAISTRTTVDGKTLLPKVSGLNYSVKLQVKVWHVNELTGTWTEMTPRMVPIEVPVNAVDETIAPAKLDQINTQVRALATAASGFYKVEVEVVP